jgi:hypothetical protein
MGEFGAAGRDVKERGVGAGDGSFGVGVFLGQTPREAEGEKEDGGEWTKAHDGSKSCDASITSRRQKEDKWYILMV